MFFFYCYGDPRDLHVLTHSFLTRRSSDLGSRPAALIRRGLGPADIAPRAGRIWLRISGYGSEGDAGMRVRSEEHTSELQSLMRRSYAVFCLKKKNNSKMSKAQVMSDEMR